MQNTIAETFMRSVSSMGSIFKPQLAERKGVSWYKNKELSKKVLIP